MQPPRARWPGQVVAPENTIPSMPDPALLESFPTPAEAPFVIEHVAEEFTSLCPVTGHPDFGTVLVRFCPRPASAGGGCVELKSLKLYLQSFRDEGSFYEALTNRIRDDLAALMDPVWLQVHTHWRGRGGIRSVIRAERGDVPAHWRGAP
jgi:7-cyano-7-deazaguanine reductase